jgi:hypothetical protein
MPTGGMWLLERLGWLKMGGVIWLGGNDSFFLPRRRLGGLPEALGLASYLSR